MQNAKRKEHYKKSRWSINSYKIKITRTTTTNKYKRNPGESRFVVRVDISLLMHASVNNFAKTVISTFNHHIALSKSLIIYHQDNNTNHAISLPWLLLDDTIMLTTIPPLKRRLMSDYIVCLTRVMFCTIQKCSLVYAKIYTLLFFFNCHI